MNHGAEVHLWGRFIAAVALDDSGVATFEYRPEFLASAIELAPLMMPLKPGVFRFPGLAREAFHGLPGLLADSLPDRFGNALINTWLATQGRSPDSFNAVERLCYVGRRGMGALEFRPLKGPRARVAQAVEIAQLVELTSSILTEREHLDVSFQDSDRQQALTQLLRVGTSAGGARAKAVIAWNPDTNEVRSGQVQADEGFSHWLLKFDGVSGNRDRELDDPRGYGAIEYACYLMAREAGIGMNECRLLEEGGRRHFMTRRFDRTRSGRKLHMQSLAAMAHFDFNLAGAYSYEQALMVIRKLGLGMETIEEQYRRMVFNVLIRNQDDHVKNIAFLMDKEGTWALSPAFDVTYAYNPQGAWTSRHQMSINGRREAFTREDFHACATSVSMKRGRADSILQEVASAVGRWREFAHRAGVESGQAEKIEEAMRMVRPGLTVT